MTRSQTRQQNNSANANANAKDNNNTVNVVINTPRRSPRLVGRYQVRRSARLNPSLQVEDKTPITMDIVEVRRRSERIKQLTPVDYLKLSGENEFSEQNDFIELADPQDYLELELDYNPNYDLSVIVDDEDDEEAEYIHHRLSELAASPLSERRYDANIDFDVASVAWRRNKRPIGNGMFAYRSRTN